MEADFIHENAVSAAQAAAKGYHGVLRIGYTAASAYEAVPRVIAAYRQRYPLVELELLEMVSTEQIVALRQQRLDLGVLRPVPIKAPLRSHCPLRESLVVAMPQSHPLALCDRIALSDCDGVPFIGFDLRNAPYFNSMVEEILHHAHVAPRFVQRATQTHAGGHGGGRPGPGPGARDMHTHPHGKPGVQAFARAPCGRGPRCTCAGTGNRTPR